MVLLEAQACGTPVITGASGGTAETMQVPETGRVVPCDGHELLANEIIELLGNPELCRQMGQAGRRWVETTFGWEALSRQAIEIFERHNESRTHHSTEKASPRKSTVVPAEH